MPFTTLPTLPHLLRRQVVYTISYHWRSLYFIIFYYRVCFIVAITADMLVRWGKLSGLCVCQLVVAFFCHLEVIKYKNCSLKNQFQCLHSWIQTQKSPEHTYTRICVCVQFVVSSPAAAPPSRICVWRTWTAGVCSVRPAWPPPALCPAVAAEHQPARPLTTGSPDTDDAPEEKVTKKEKKKW